MLKGRRTKRRLANKTIDRTHYIVAGALALLLGAVIGDTTIFINYYFGKHLSDSIILLLLAGSSFWAGSIISTRLNTILLVLSLLLLHLTVGIRYSYFLYQINEWTSTALYIIIAGMAFLTGWQQEIDKIKRSVFILASIIGFILVVIIGIKSSVLLMIVCISLVLTQLVYRKHKRVMLYLLVTLPVITAYLLFSTPPTYFERQSKYFDPLVFSQETPFHKVDITSWKGQEWFYYNNINQFSSIDHWLYFEPMAHVASQLITSKRKILVIGGENGMLTHQLLKYDDNESIDVIPIDTELYNLAKHVPHFTRLNKGALVNDKVNQIDDLVFDYLSGRINNYDLIFVDVPDPVDIELNQYYTKEFYNLCHRALTNKGILVTQAGSPYYATKAFNSIDFTIQSSDFITLSLHNQVLTLGEWGWIIGFKGTNQNTIDFLIQSTRFDQVKTKWLNKEAVHMMMAFGKQPEAPDTVVNSIKKPVVHEYYTTGTWKLQ